jgi:hypothetical protein
MLAATPAPPVAYLWEPFSVLHRPGIFAVRFPFWFPYICSENEDPYLEPIRDMLAFRYRPRAELAAARSPKDLARLARDCVQFARYRHADARPLLKDPIAVFSAPWLCDTFDAEVIALIRHPAAFANSVVRRGLRHPFGDFLRQPLLMRDVLSPFRDRIEEFSVHEQPLLDQAILLWNLIHHAILGYRRDRPHWLFYRLEDLARDPEPAFRAIYGRLGLSFNAAVRQEIREHSDPSNPAEVRDPAALRRDSAASVVAWKSRLSPNEVERIRAGTEPIASAFYGHEDW